MELELHFPKIFVVCTWAFIIVYIYTFDPITHRFSKQNPLYIFSAGFLVIHSTE
jgi:hypothetical protein